MTDANHSSMFITEPTVHLLAEPAFHEHPLYELPVKTIDTATHDDPLSYEEVLEGTASEQLTAHAGKGCFDSYGRDGRGIVEHVEGLIDSGHGSVLEHSNVSLFIAGISRGCSHEFVRHRAGFAYSQRSTRYVDEGECNVVLEPWVAELYATAEAAGWEVATAMNPPRMKFLKHYCTALRLSVRAYREAVEQLIDLVPPTVEGKVAQRKWARGKARQLLPIGLETRMTVTANLRAWRHFLVMRSGRFAEAEIRRLSNEIFNVLYPVAPVVFEELQRGSKRIDGYMEYAPANPRL